MENVKDKFGMEGSEIEEILGERTGEFRRDFVEEVNAKLRDRIQEQGMRPSIEITPYDDDDAQWYAAHSDKTRYVICNTPEHRDSPFCGSGWH